MSDNIVEVFKTRYGSWTFDCHECVIGGGKTVDQPNAFWEAEQHLREVHSDLQPWEV